MSTTGPNSPSTTTDRAASPAQAWVNPNNVQASDNTYATHTTTTGEDVTDWIDCTGFAFSSIPAGSIIDGIVVEIEKKAASNGVSWGKDADVQLLKAGSAVGTDKADTVTKWSTTEAYYTYGSSSDLWGTTWTRDEVAATNFGVTISATNHNGS